MSGKVRLLEHEALQLHAEAAYLEEAAQLSSVLERFPAREQKGEDIQLISNRLEDERNKLNEKRGLGLLLIDRVKTLKEDLLENEEEEGDISEISE